MPSGGTSCGRSWVPGSAPVLIGVGAVIVAGLAKEVSVGSVDSVLDALGYAGGDLG